MSLIQIGGKMFPIFSLSINLLKLIQCPNLTLKYLFHVFAAI